MRIIFLLNLLAAIASAASWKLAWSDEFDGPANTPPDPSKWVYDLGHNEDGWGNKELQSYTNSLENIHHDGQGHLIIRALRDESGHYTSGRLKTKSKFAATFGKIEARIKIAGGQGIWPAFWAMGADIDTAGWPDCGEIDIMENIGREYSIQHASLHGPGYSGTESVTGSVSLSGGRHLSSDFHVFGVVWEKDNIQFILDGQPYLTASPASLPPGKSWAFNKPFFLLLNLAVGGTWPGSPNKSTVFPQDMTIDYVRVYQSTATH
jgi:beta-glucanase (GH16 family)